MKIAIIGGKTLLDIVFLNKLSSEISNIDLECYGDSGEISLGAKHVIIQDINKIDIQKFDVIMNLSNEYSFILDIIKSTNTKSNKKIIYINNIEGILTINGIKTTKTQNLIKLPNFSIEPIAKLLSVIEVNNLILTINKPIAELGKEAMNQFYYEIKESQFRVIQHNEKNHSEALAFNMSFPCPTNTTIQNEINKEQDSEEEIKIIKQLNTFTKAKIILNICRVPVNKGSSIIATFEAKKETSEKNLINKLEALGLIYVSRQFSTILTENDNAIYFTKIKKIDNVFSIIFMFDSIQTYTKNAINILLELITIKN